MTHAARAQGSRRPRHRRGRRRARPLGGRSRTSSSACPRYIAEAGAAAGVTIGAVDVSVERPAAPGQGHRRPAGHRPRADRAGGRPLGPGRRPRPPRPRARLRPARHPHAARAADHGDLGDRVRRRVLGGARRRWSACACARSRRAASSRRDGAPARRRRTSGSPSPGSTSRRRACGGRATTSFSPEPGRGASGVSSAGRELTLRGDASAVGVRIKLPPSFGGRAGEFGAPVAVHLVWEAIRGDRSIDVRELDADLGGLVVEARGRVDGLGPDAVIEATRLRAHRPRRRLPGHRDPAAGLDGRGARRSPRHRVGGAGDPRPALAAGRARPHAGAAVRVHAGRHREDAVPEPPVPLRAAGQRRQHRGPRGRERTSSPSPPSRRCSWTPSCSPRTRASTATPAWTWRRSAPRGRTTWSAESSPAAGPPSRSSS